MRKLLLSLGSWRFTLVFHSKHFIKFLALTFRSVWVNGVRVQLHLYGCLVVVSAIRRGLHSPGLPRWLSGKDSACQCRRHGYTPWEDSLEKEMATLSVFLPGKSPEQRSLVTAQRVGHDPLESSGVTKSWTQLSTHAPSFRRWLSWDSCPKSF